MSQTPLSAQEVAAWGKSNQFALENCERDIASGFGGGTETRWNHLTQKARLLATIAERDAEIERLRALLAAQEAAPAELPPSPPPVLPDAVEVLDCATRVGCVGIMEGEFSRYYWQKNMRNRDRCVRWTSIANVTVEQLRNAMRSDLGFREQCEQLVASAGSVSPNQSEKPELDWRAAEAHVYEVWANSKFASPWPEIQELGRRYHQNGERSRELYDAMMKVGEP